MNRELVRVKGREGWTPIHFASHMEDVELLAKFLFACPESIENVTVRGETALHIDISCTQFMLELSIGPNSTLQNRLVR
jgi:ankyrin repeat protein